MREKSKQKLYTIRVVLDNGTGTRDVQIKAASREAAERRAIKFTKGATDVVRDS